MRCTERAHAKVNLTLEVGAKRADGYHEVTSVMQRIGLWDTVTVECGTGRDRLVCGVPVTESEDDNLCMKAVRAFFEETGLESGGVTVTLEKRIPVQAGLGGGSSDAAAVLRALRRLYAPDMGDGRLEALAARLGSDVPFFIRGGTQLATGRGEVVAPLPGLTAGWFVVVKPEEGYSTAEMYQRLDALGAAGTRRADAMAAAVAGNDIRAVAAALYNDFERAVPEGGSLAEIKTALRERGALGALLSGSGSAVFGVFSGREAAMDAAEELKKRWPLTFAVQPVYICNV